MRKPFLATFTAAFIALFSPLFVWAITVSDTGLMETGTQVYGEEQGSVSLGTYLGEHVITPFFGLLGIVFLILTLYGGILWMMSGGNSENLSKAKRILIHSIIGLVIIFAAYGFTYLIFESILL